MNKNIEENKDNDEIDNGAKIFCNFIAQNYSPIGESEDRVFRSSQELAYQVREMCNIGTSVISNLLEKAGFKIRFIDGIPYWEMFEKFYY